jgi:hypothetical protein
MDSLFGRLAPRKEILLQYIDRRFWIVTFLPEDIMEDGGKKQ